LYEDVLRLTSGLRPPPVPVGSREGPINEKARIMECESISGPGKLMLALASVVGLAALAIPCAQAQTLSVVHNFTGGSDGGNPVNGFTMSATGTLYGTASSGGSSGYGVVFKVGDKGDETVLHSFAGGSDGATPNGGVIEDPSGAFFGTTTTGGTSGLGTVVQGEENEGDRVVQLRRGHGRRGSPGRAGHGCRGESLRHNQRGRIGRQWHGFRARCPKGKERAVDRDGALQLRHRYGRSNSDRRCEPGRGRQPVRYDVVGRYLRIRHGLSG